MQSSPKSPATPARHTPPRRSRWRRLTIALIVLGLLGLGLAIGARVASSLVRDRVVALGAHYGLEIEVGSVDLSLFSGIGVSEVRVFAPSAGDQTPRTQLGEFAHIQTDVSLIDAIGGARRPGRLEVRGGSLLARWNDGPVDVRAKHSEGGVPTEATEAIVVRLSDVDVKLEARQTTPAGLLEFAPLAFLDLELEATRDTDRTVRLAGKARLDSAGRVVDSTFELDTRTGRLALTLGEGAELVVKTPRGELVATARTLEAAKTLVVTDLGLSLGNDRLGMRRLELTPESASLLDALKTLREPAPWASLAIEGLHAEHLDTNTTPPAERKARVEKLTAVIRGGEVPRPTSMSSEGVEVRWTSVDHGVDVDAETGRIDLAFAADLPLTELLSSPLSSVTRLEVSKPSLDIRLLRPLDPSDDHANPDPEVPTQPAGQPGQDDEPPALIANDEDLPPVEQVVPAFAPGKDWLGALLGSADSGQSGTLLDLLPAELRERLPSLIGQLATLGPRIDEASVTIRNAEGEAMLSLESGGFSARIGELGAVLAARAAVYRDGKEAAKVDLEVALSKDLTIESLSSRVSGRSIANQVARFVKALSVQDDAEIDLTLTYTRPRDDDAPHHVEGEVSLRNFSFEFWRIADREIKDLQAKAVFDASIDRKNHRLLLSLPRIEVGESHFTATLDLTRKANKLPRFTARLAMPRQDCGAAGRSIPKGLIPNLSTLELVGQMEFDITLDLDLGNPRALSLKVGGDVSACEARNLGPGIDPMALRGDYVHTPREPKRGVLEHIRVGPGTPEWVPMQRIPPLVLSTAWITEDRKYREHGGVRWDLVQTALKMDLDHGRFIYGGSTITQQLVKNLYLTRDKNLARKLEEMIIAWHMERVLTKDEILTLYVNCIEYGPDIYGIRHAARAYFDKRVEDLDALETAFIMGLKPYPRAGYAQFLKGTFDHWWVRRVSYVLRLMAKYEPTLITLEEAEAFAPFIPKFRAPPGAGIDGVPRARRR